MRTEKQKLKRKAHIKLMRKMGGPWSGAWQKRRDTVAYAIKLAEKRRRGELILPPRMQQEVEGLGPTL